MLCMFAIRHLIYLLAKAGEDAVDHKVRGFEMRFAHTVPGGREEAMGLVKNRGGYACAGVVAASPQCSPAPT